MAFGHKTVEQAYTPFGAKISADASVSECARKMCAHGIGLLLIMEGEALKGVVSERDIAYKVVAQDLSPSETLVRDIMTTKVYTVAKQELLKSAWRFMSEKGIRHLVVQESEEDSSVVGVLGLRDLIEKEQA